ncbi:MAG: AmmeMemoRadiSam system protein A, partial [Candidatus Kryptoniota bacterium]
MADDYLTEEEKHYLLKVARQALEEYFGISSQEQLPPPTPKLLQPGATFVTLTIDGQLRGCIGTLEAYQPLIEDVKEHAIAAAVQDYRFPPLTAKELPYIKIEISRLTKPERLHYQHPLDLAQRIRPGIDGVVLQWRGRRATFLPQVWEKIPSPEEFLDHLCM